MEATFIKRILRATPGPVAAIIGINILVSLTLWLLAGASALLHLHLDYMEEWLTLPPALSELAIRPWTPVTYMFTQISPWHLLFNMMWLYLFGTLMCRGVMERFDEINDTDTALGIPPAQTPHTARTLAWLYIAGGLAGALFFLIDADNTYVGAPHLAGASAAVLAWATAAACRIPSMRVNLLLFGRVRMIWIAIAAIALAFIGGGGTGANFMPHLGGAVAGLAYGLFPIMDLKERSRRMRRKARAAKAAEIFRTASPTDRSIAASRGKAENRERLDALLDKIRLSGYDSLTSDERFELEILSRNI